MTTYVVLAKIDQIVTKEVRLEVVAGSEEEASKKAVDALQEYPKAIQEQGVNRVVTLKSNYWIPRSIDVTKITEEKEPEDKTA